MTNRELDWLSKKYKGTPVPEIVYSGTIEYGGCYYDPYTSIDGKHYEICINNKMFNSKNGVIEIGHSCDDHHIQHTIAHEYRHHIQYMVGLINYDGIGNYIDNNNMSYENFVKNYFLKSKYELDALLFAYKYVKSSTATYWMDLIHQAKNIKVIEPLITS